MQQSISFSLIIIPLCQTKLENSSLNVISFSVRSSPARLSPPRPGRSFQNVSGKAFTSSVGKIVSNHLWQGFHLLNREDIFKPSLARFSPPRPGRSFSNLLMQGFHLLDRADRFQTFSGKTFTSSTGSPMNLATVSGVMPSGRRLRTPDMALLSKRPIFANIIKIVELRLGLGDSNRVCP